MKNTERSAMTTAVDRVIWRRDLMKDLGICSETLRRWTLAGKIPTPDVKLSQKVVGWKLSTLQAAGIGLV